MARYPVGSTETFTQKAIARHGYQYDYRRVVYIRSCEKVEIGCKVCQGVFWQTPNKHLMGRGCPTCAAKDRDHRVAAWTQRVSVEAFITRAQATHPEVDYTRTAATFVDTQTPCAFLCRRCGGEFWQSQKVKT